MKIWLLIQKTDWRISAVTAAAATVILFLIYRLFSKARKIDLPFLHITMKTEQRRRRR